VQWQVEFEYGCWKNICKESSDLLQAAFTKFEHGDGAAEVRVDRRWTDPTSGYRRHSIYDVSFETMTVRSLASEIVRNLRNLRGRTLSEVGASNVEEEECYEVENDADEGGDEEVEETEAVYEDMPLDMIDFWPGKNDHESEEMDNDALAGRQVAQAWQLQWQFQGGDGWHNMGADINEHLLEAYTNFMICEEEAYAHVETLFWNVSFESMTWVPSCPNAKARNIRCVSFESLREKKSEE
jgi:hypothetical protein